MIVKLLTEHHLEFLSFKGGCTGSYDSTLVKIPLCLKSHVAAHLCFMFWHFEWQNQITQTGKACHVQAIIEPRHVISNNVAF